MAVQVAVGADSLLQHQVLAHLEIPGQVTVRMYFDR